MTTLLDNGPTALSDSGQHVIRVSRTGLFTVSYVPEIHGPETPVQGYIPTRHELLVLIRHG